MWYTAYVDDRDQYGGPEALVLCIHSNLTLTRTQGIRYMVSTRS